MSPWCSINCGGVNTSITFINLYFYYSFFLTLKPEHDFAIFDAIRRQSALRLKSGSCRNEHFSVELGNSLILSFIDFKQNHTVVT